MGTKKCLCTKILRETHLAPNKLELEITENIIMKEPEYIIDSLTQLKELGIKIAIDDFGTEYSSLNYIKQLPIDRIKIAMSFIQGININEKVNYFHINLKQLLGQILTHSPHPVHNPVFTNILSFTLAIAS